MGRFRSLVRHAAKPFAFALVAGIMSLSLIVTTPSNAHAFELGDTIVKAPPRVVAGMRDALSGAVRGVVAASPEIMTAGGEAASVAGRVGFRFLGGPWVGAALLLWDTKDAWFPFVVDAVNGAFGSSTAPTLDPSASVYPDVSISSLAVSGSTATYHSYYGGSSYHYGATLGATTTLVPNE